MGRPFAIPVIAAVIGASAVSADTGTLTVRSVALTGERADLAALGQLRPLGLLELPRVKVDGLSFSQLSGLAWDEDEGVLYALSDKGALFHLTPEFRDGNLSGLVLRKAAPLHDAAGKPLKPRDADSEGLDVLRGRNGRRGDAELLVSFERTPRIYRYSPAGKLLGELPLPAPLRALKQYRDPNRMLESVCHDPARTTLTAPEAPRLDESGTHTHLYGLDGRKWRYPLEGHFRISALECLGDGRVLVLERDFGRVLGRRAVRLRLAHLPAQPPSAGIGVETLATLDAADGFAVDNFEGLARHQGNRFFMVSDDNDLFVQRTLLLYFELAGLKP
jgi:hypothetical protein